MTKPLSLEQSLAALRQLRETPDRPAAAPELANHLSSKHNLVAAKAAELAGQWNLQQLEPDLARAFHRFMTPAADKGCSAKTEIARALDRLESRDTSLFLSGLHHFQPEPVWGGSADAAAELRSICAAALVRLNYRDVLTELADLLMDAEPAARIGAVRAIAFRGGDDAAPLLRLKILAGDPITDVIAESFAALLKLAPVQSLPFVERFLDRRELEEDLRQAALLAVGESHTPQALSLLRARWEKALTIDERRPLLLAIAMTRRPEAIELLRIVIAEEHKSVAAAAIEAMRLYRNDEAVREKISSAVDSRDEMEVREAFKKTFG